MLIDGSAMDLSPHVPNTMIIRPAVAATPRGAGSIAKPRKLPGQLNVQCYRIDATFASYFFICAHFLGVSGLDSSGRLAFSCADLRNAPK
jgi:hypothetical protein